jgi:HSP20 family molecular chaperone IbpA
MAAHILTRALRQNLGVTAPPVRSFPIDVIEEDKTIDIYAELPGVRDTDIDIDFYNNKLTVSVRKIRRYPLPTISEISYGETSREILLSVCVTRSETVQARYDNGVLHIHINKLIEEENRFRVRLNGDREAS